MDGHILYESSQMFTPMSCSYFAMKLVNIIRPVKLPKILWTQYSDILFDIEYPKEAMATNSDYQLKRRWLLSLVTIINRIIIVTEWGSRTQFPTLISSLWTPAGFNSILTLSTWRWHQISQIKGSVLQGYPHSARTHTHTPLRHQPPTQALTCASDQQAVDWRFQWSPSWIQLIC